MTSQLSKPDTERLVGQLSTCADFARASADEFTYLNTAAREMLRAAAAALSVGAQSKPHGIRDLPAILAAIVDGWTSGNETFDDFDVTMQTKFMSAALAVEALPQRLPVTPHNSITDQQGLEWFEHRFGVPLGDMPGREEVERIRAGLPAPAPQDSFQCMGRKQSLPEPGECNWPDCGCDPYAAKVIAALQEQCVIPSVPPPQERQQAPGPHANAAWAASRWQSEVANRPLQNVHRRALDTTWRQVIRHFGGNDEALCGPTHDQLVAILYQEENAERPSAGIVVSNEEFDEIIAVLDEAGSPSERILRGEQLLHTLRAKR